MNECWKMRKQRKNSEYRRVYSIWKTRCGFTQRASTVHSNYSRFLIPNNFAYIFEIEKRVKAFSGTATPIHLMLEIMNMWSSASRDLFCTYFFFFLLYSNLCSIRIRMTMKSLSCKLNEGNLISSFNFFLLYAYHQFIYMQSNSTMVSCWLLGLFCY